MGAEQLLSRIEELRHLLYSMAKDRRLADPEVVHLSQKLDKLLNQYYFKVLRG